MESPKYNLESRRFMIAALCCCLMIADDPGLTSPTPIFTHKFIHPPKVSETMKTFTPQIAWHDRQPILSVDIQNRLYSKEDSRQLYRLATGGNDSRVNIWKIALSHIWDQKKPLETIDCLAELTQHQRSVNIVRFSPNLEDNLLASGDDDSLIIIWKHFPPCDNENIQKNANTVEVGKVQPKEENVGDNMLEDTISDEIWKPYKTLRGHNQDVADISWSKDGQYLVSGSIDNNVFVWDVHGGKKLHKVVKEHYSFVQGVSWDPLNRYIASLSADRNMLVFNIKTGKTVHRVNKITFEENQNEATEKKPSSKLFFDQTLMSFCRRLTFSPGGELLFAPSGIFETSPDDYKNTVYVFERNSLSRPSLYLPLPKNKFSVAVSCCPVVFELKLNTENMFKFPYRIIFAVVTQDSILFYDSQQMFPFAYVSQVHYLRLTDLSWSPDGRVLMVTSSDGFITFVMFDQEELGVQYQGKLLELEELEPAAVAVNTENKPAKKEKQPKVKEAVEKEKEAKIKTPKVKTPVVSTPTSKNITTFFKKLLPSTASSPPNNQPQPGRRVSLITLFSNSKQDEKKSEPMDQSPTVQLENNKYETGIKRKLGDNENDLTTSKNNIMVIELD